MSAKKTTKFLYSTPGGSSETNGIILRWIRTIYWLKQCLILSILPATFQTNSALLLPLYKPFFPNYMYLEDLVHALCTEY